MVSLQMQFCPHAAASPRGSSEARGQAQEAPTQRRGPQAEVDRRRLVYRHGQRDVRHCVERRPPVSRIFSATLASSRIARVIVILAKACLGKICCKTGAKRRQRAHPCTQRGDPAARRPSARQALAPRERGGSGRNRCQKPKFASGEAKHPCSEVTRALALGPSWGLGLGNHHTLRSAPGRPVGEQNHTHMNLHLLADSDLFYARQALTNRVHAPLHCLHRDRQVAGGSGR